MFLEERTYPGLHSALVPYMRSLQLPSDARILDVGCGTGAWLKRLHEAGFRNLWGIDRDEQGFKLSDLARFIAADLDHVSAFPRDFSLVTIIETIEHVENPYRLLKLAGDALASGGWMLITSPNIYSLRARMRFLISPHLPHFERCSQSPVEQDHIHPLVFEAYKRKIFDPLSLSLEKLWTYPERGSHGSRWFAGIIAAALGWLLPDPLSGDNLCLLFRKP